MAITSAILAITSATQQQMAITSAKPGNKICQKNTILPQCGITIATVAQLVPSINKKTMAITSAKHGNNICQQQKVAITSATKWQ